MTKVGKLLKALLSAPLKFLTHSRIIPDNTLSALKISPDEQLAYIIKTDSVSDRIMLEKACKKLGLPAPNQTITSNGKSFDNTWCLENPGSILLSDKPTNAIADGSQLLQAHRDDPSLNVKLIPVAIFWGRDPKRETGSIKAIIADSESPSWLRKAFIVMTSLRHNFLRFSQPVSLRYMADNHGADEATAHKLTRVARFHFYRQKLAAAGPRLWSQEEMFNSVSSSTSVQQTIENEIAAGNLTPEKARLEARKLTAEIAADYRASYIRFAEKFLSRLWNKLYNGIKVNNADVVRDLAHKGHEIVYMPCHRSHMDYLLLTYVIYQEGLVPPHIAAGINLNFWPAGTIFRRCGAFFMRRSFKGSKLYSTIFKEYLSQLFKKGYPVKFYTEGGRSRSGRLLAPKTGMLAMTIQSMLRDLDRPVTVVPVYIGYEHVMEVKTYLKELKGSAKKGESIGGVLKTIKNLKDYGYGYVNFGQPVNLNNWLSDNIPDWRDAFELPDHQKPTWLTPAVNDIANKVMMHINNSTALNAATLAAITLLAANKHALTRKEFEEQLDFYLTFHRYVTYADEVTVPGSTGHQMIEHLIKLRKIEVSKDAYGDIVSLPSQEAIFMNYYRNNILQLFVIPGLVAAQVLASDSIHKDQLIHDVQLFYPLFKDELFMNDRDPEEYISQVIDGLIYTDVLHEEDGVISPTSKNSNGRFKLHLLAKSMDTTTQRYFITTGIISAEAPLSRADLESKCQSMATRMSSLHNISAPEFFDKKVLSAFINSLKINGYLETINDGLLIGTEKMAALNDVLMNITDGDFIHSMRGKQ